MTVAFSQEHNFYMHDCRTIGQNIYYGSCQQRIRKIADGTDAGRWPECEKAIKDGTCAAQRMIKEDFEAAFSFGDGHGTKYYRDRDDCGPGVMKRAELGLPERSMVETALHHLILKDLALTPYAGDGLTERQKSILAERTAFAEQREPTKTQKATQRTLAERAAKQPTAPANDSATNASGVSASSFDLGALINAEVAKLQGAA